MRAGREVNSNNPFLNIAESMSRSSEDVLLQVPHVKYKKLEGILFVMSERLVVIFLLADFPLQLCRLKWSYNWIGKNNNTFKSRKKVSIECTFFLKLGTYLQNLGQHFKLEIKGTFVMHFGTHEAHILPYFKNKNKGQNKNWILISKLETIRYNWTSEMALPNWDWMFFCSLFWRSVQM